MRFRQANLTDASTLVNFQVAMAKETEDIELDRPTCVRGVAAVFEDPSKGRYYVGEDQARVVASLLITTEWSDWRAGVVWWIQSVYVLPEFRGQGFYRGLYDHVRGLAGSDSSVRGIRLYVDRRNQNAQKVYERLGMDGEHYLVYEWMK